MSRRAAALVVATAILASLEPGQLAAQDLERGQALYDRWCAGCHGVEGRGDGPAAAYMLPRPRDFTLGIYQIRTTASGELPRDKDVIRVIESGMPGTAMPGWESKLNGREVRDVVAYLKTFSRFFQGAEAPAALDFGRAPAEGLAEGREFYERIECFKCHGDAGRADGRSAPTLQDDLDFPIRAADLTKNWTFNGGGSVEDIFRRLRTGLDGSPMPSFSDVFGAQFTMEDGRVVEFGKEQLWHLAQYVRSLSPKEPPRAREVVVAGRIEGELPASPDDSIWESVQAFYIPMVGQIIQDPRWFAPTVNGLQVSALHNDNELALRLVWNDPSRSPDPAWIEWQQRVAESMFPLQDSTGVALLPDMMAVQFPTSIPTGRERPYFLMGDSRRPVYLWQWNSGSEGAVEARATGLETMQSQPAGSQTLSAAATWDRGQWRLLLSRSLATADSTNELQFRTAEAIPIAFFAWDGSNGETGKQMAVSSWYAIYLERPTPATVYISPLLAIVLTAGLAFGLVWRAQRRELEAGST